MSISIISACKFNNPRDNYITKKVFISLRKKRGQFTAYAMILFIYCLLVCLSSTCACPTNRKIKSQDELDRYIEDAIRSGNNDTRCIQWTLIGSAYQLDLIKLLKIQLQQNDSLIIQGHNGSVVDIDCVGRPSNLEEHLEAIQPLSHASLFVLDSLNFMGCPVPILVEEVSKVMISNCVFQ